MRAVQMDTPGGPEVLKLREVPLAAPAAGEVQLQLRYAGLNFIDVYHRSGLYPLPMPATLGREGMGTVEQLGEGVSGLSVGQRVAFAMHPGSYAERVNVPAWLLAPVPDAVSDEVAAAAMLQGLTAQFLTRTTWPLAAGQLVVVHAAAGGVGGLLVQLGRLLGATVLATAGSEAKRQLARELGAHEVASYDEFAEVARGLGRAHVIYDGVGQATFRAGLDALRPRGMMVLYGAASGPVEPLDPQLLNQKGSLFLTRPSLGAYIQDAAEVQQRAAELFGWIAAGQLQVRVDRVFDLSEVAEAHRHIEARGTLGKVLIRTGG
ncbi:quinone oxidoreductase [Deinococcus sonorensis]|uniref:Quinone oxidoreductase n=2 Tax=Deinococcus sonorensis TaxID=309891 RepID=A0AAU7U6R4_9DEIO